MIKYLRVLRSLGHICIILSIVMLLPVICALCYGEYKAILNFLVPAAVISILGALAVIFTAKYKTVQIGIRLSAVTVVFSWLIAILIGSFPFILLEDMSFTKSIFESVSGWTTTGLTVINNVENAFKSTLLWRSLTQFLGGVGIILVLQLIIRGNQNAVLYQAEGHGERVLPNMRKSIMLILGIYCLYMVIGTILYLIGGMSFFDALNHSMTAIATGGFSTKSESIGAFNSIYIECITIFLMLLGGISFSVHILLFFGKFKQVAKVFELRVMGILLIIAVPLISFVGLSSIFLTAGQQFRIGIFETVSAMTSGGFSINNTVPRSGFITIFLIILMLIGANLGSTSGGIKQYRIGIALKSFYWNIKKKVISENKVYQPCIYNSTDKIYLSEEDLSKNNTFILMFLFIWVIGSLFITALGPFSMEQSFFEFASIMGNTGLSSGLTASAPDSVLWVMIFGMFLGRLEITIVFVAFSKFFSDCFKKIKKAKNKSL